MPKKSETLSIGAQGAQSTDSVYDFLYYDTARSASFLSQFDKAGHLKEVKQGDRSSSKVRSSNKLEYTGNVAVVKGSAIHESGGESENGRDNQRVYDPRWSNALSFLDYLDERELLHRDITASRIGQIVLFSGELSIFDLGMLRQMWGLPSIRKLLMQSSTPESPIAPAANRMERRKNTAGQKSQSNAAPTETELAVDLMGVLPHAVQCAVSTDDASVWSSLREDNLTISPADLFMKHGLTIAGTWNMVGILDALPDEPDVMLDAGVMLSSARQFLAGSKLGHLTMHIAPGFVTAMREIMGRPKTSYGVTPLLVFRSISDT